MSISADVKQRLDAIIANIQTVVSNVATKYTKPTSGIPKTDLASSVQTSLGKADDSVDEAAVLVAIEEALNEYSSNTNLSQNDRTIADAIWAWTKKQYFNGGLEADGQINAKKGMLVQTLLSVTAPIVQIDNTGTQVEALSTTNDIIKTRASKDTALATGEFTGIEAHNYNGQNTTGRLVFDKTGTAYVGDSGQEQPLLTRDVESDMTNGQILKWDGTDKKAKTTSLSSVGIQPASDNSLDTTSKTIPGAINEVNSLAKGANQALSYSNYSAMITAFNSLANTAYKVGQNVMIVTLNVPDLWISSVESTSTSYSYTNDTTVVSELNSNGYIQVGYYKLSRLETQKVDLTAYMQKTDCASTSEIDGRTATNKFIAPSTLEYAVRSVLPLTASTVAATLVPRTEYYLGEQSNLALNFPTTGSNGQYIFVCFKSGSTATTLTISGATAGDTSITPIVNKTYEILANWNGSAWALSYIAY